MTSLIEDKDLATLYTTALIGDLPELQQKLAFNKIKPLVIKILELESQIQNLNNQNAILEARLSESRNVKSISPIRTTAEGK